MNTKYILFNSNKGFTLIELLIVVSIIGLLAGISLSVINPTRQRNIAQESINKQSMLKISEGIEASYIATLSSEYPEELFVDGKPLPLTQLNESDLPEGMIYKTNSSKSEFCLCIPSLVKNDIYLWYKSSSDNLQEIESSCDSSCE